jgi:hypothetical protein
VPRRSGSGELPTGGGLALDRRAEPPPHAGAGPYDGGDLDPEATDAAGTVDFGAVRVPVPADGTVTVEPSAGGRMQAVHIALPAGRLSVSALAAPKSSTLWPELAGEIETSLRDGGARVRSFPGDWGRELHATTGASTSVFVGVDGPRWMLYGVATGPTAQAETLDGELRRMLRSTVVVRGRSPYPVRTVLPLEVPEHLREQLEEAPAAVPRAAAVPAAAAGPEPAPRRVEPVRRIPGGPGAPDPGDAATEVWPVLPAAPAVPDPAPSRVPAAAAGTRPGGRRRALDPAPTEPWALAAAPVEARSPDATPAAGGGRRRAPENGSTVDGPSRTLGSEYLAAGSAPAGGRRRAAEPVVPVEPAGSRPGRRRAVQVAPVEPVAEPRTGRRRIGEPVPPTGAAGGSDPSAVAPAGPPRRGGRHAAPEVGERDPVTERLVRVPPPDSGRPSGRHRRPD